MIQQIVAHSSCWSSLAGYEQQYCQKLCLNEKTQNMGRQYVLCGELLMCRYSFKRPETGVGAGFRVSEKSF